MTDKTIPTPEELRKLLRYEPETGKLFWKHRPEELFKNPKAAAPWNGRFAGKQAFTSDADASLGYPQGTINGRSYLATKVIFAIQLGKWPEKEVFCINGDLRDTTWKNLKLADHSQLCQKKKIGKNNTSGVKGVSWHSAIEKWQARIEVNGKTHYLGYFHDKEDAAKAYEAASRRYHGEFSRLK